MNTGKSASFLFGKIAIIFSIFTGIFIYFHLTTLLIVYSVLAIIYCGFAIYFHFHKPKKPLRAGYLGIEGFKFRDK